jgi:ankyrin repeat protein
MKQNALVNGADEKGITPLILAAQQGWSDVVERLLAMGADPTKIAHSGQRASDFAAAKGYSSTAAAFRKKEH